MFPMAVSAGQIWTKDRVRDELAAWTGYLDIDVE
jgi:hypothetical protein